MKQTPSSQSQNTIQIAAHRGYAAAYPENTLPAIEAAVAAGIMAVEIDVQFSKDGVPILLHDVDFKRVAECATNVLHTNFTDLKSIVIAEHHKFADKFNHVSVCTLSELVEFMLKNPRLMVFVEIKHESVDHFGEAFIINQLNNILHKVKQQCVIISISSKFIKRIREQFFYCVGYILTLWDESNLGKAQWLRPEFVICNHQKIPDIDFSNFPWQWLLYEITTCQQLNYYSRLGVQWVETMNPVKLLDCSTRVISDLKNE
ncbi:hypothetical protein MNBD_GAMMA12-3742 [hydrothermal vent metagenome]|uniref:GP-PDE domain-containing protein n=1 Tax=hydrothermal vent metagenome TaxID=652676 RepID=A0A3B0YZS1_9ZZZZ